MNTFHFIPTVLFIGAITGILLVKNASIECKIILVFGLLALSAYIRLNIYLLLLTALALFTFVGFALLWSRFAVLKLTAQRKIKEEALVGENVRVEYALKTDSPFSLYHVRLWDNASRMRSDGSYEEISFESPGYISLLGLHRRENGEGSQHIVPKVRGVMELGPIAIEGGDPFGLFTVVRWLPVGDSMLVLPSWERLGMLPAIPSLVGAKEREQLVNREGQSHEFLGTRPWSDGDSLRRVHWPLTARHNKLIVRQFEREIGEEMLIVLDADRDADVGDGAENALEYLITISLSLVHTAIEIGRPWTFVTVDEETVILSYRDKEAFLSVQYSLARLGAMRDDPIEGHLDAIRKRYPNAACVLLTARTDPAPSVELAEGDARLGGGGRSLLIRVDPVSFAGLADGSARRLKRRRHQDSREKPVEPKAHAPKFVPGFGVPEFTVTRGDRVADLFASRMAVR
ncbi:MAG: DUF58 domain-containing protein [bacterium]